MNNETQNNLCVSFILVLKETLQLQKKEKEINIIKNYYKFENNIFLIYEFNLENKKSKFIFDINGNLIKDLPSKAIKTNDLSEETDLHFYNILKSIIDEYSYVLTNDKSINKCPHSSACRKVYNKAKQKRL